MRALNLRSLLVAVVVYGTPALVAAQNPTPQQAQQMLQSNPALIEQLRQRIATSGLTPDQVRARLKAQGYPENLLDSYLNGSTSSSGQTGSAGQPPDNVFSAVRELGIADTTDLDLLRCGVNPDSLTVPGDLFGLGSGSSSGTIGTSGAVRRPVAGSSSADTLRYQQERLRTREVCASLGDSARYGTRRPGQPADSGYKIFGMDFFRSPGNQFVANSTGPIDAGYRLGPGDRLVLVLTGDVEASYALDVTREGFVVIPQVGEIFVNNLTLGQLENILYDRLGRVYSGVRRGAGSTTRFSITPARIRSNLVYVVGDVVRPGAYQVSAAGTLLNALYAAGGPTDNGSLRDLQVRREGKLAARMDFYNYLVNGDASQDVRLQNGDIVFVPVHLARARIVGEVVRPATYEIKASETLADALRFAGGFTENAARQRVQIERVVAPSERAAGRDRIVTDIVSNAFLTGTGPTVPVQPGDVIRVFPVTAHVRNRVYVRGNVNAPGTIGLSTGMTVSEALRLAGGVKPNTYLGEVLVTRLQPDSSRTQLRATLRDTTGAVLNDFRLNEDDEIRVFSVTEFRPNRYVAVNGAVRKSGQVPYREGMTVRDLVLEAGGLEQSAYLNEARIARLPADRSAGVTAREFTVPLDSSYLFERGRDGRYSGPPGLPAPAGPSPEVVLQPYDNVLILRQPNWELQRTVAVTGEVRFPGRYSLVAKSERISELLRRAGGLTPEGYANGVTFFRTRDSIGRVGIELPNVLTNAKSPDNLLLQDGDSIFIPRYSAIVRVQGAVNSPVAVTYVAGEDLNYYIRASGGASLKADVGRAYVTQPNGKVDAETQRFLIPDYIPKPQPGSTVYVPVKDATANGLDPFALIGSLTGVLSSLVAVVALLRR